MANVNEVGFYGEKGEGKRLIYSSLISVLILCYSATAMSEDLGIIQVESTTIDDKFDSKREEPSNIGAISGETVDRAHTENIQQLLQSIPGVTTEVQSGESLKIHIRGVENQTYMGERPGVAVVIDGVPVFERTGRVNIDLDNIESIKVVKGGASYLFGDDALAGAVIITTKRGANMAGVKLSGEVGSFDYQKRLIRAGYAGENWSGHIQRSRRKTDGYYDDSGSQSDYLNGKLQYYIDDSSDLTFGFEQADRMKNSHGAVKGVTNAKNDPESKDPNNEYDDYANHFEVELAKYFLTYSRDMNDSDNLLVNIYQYSDQTYFKSSPIDGAVDSYYNDNDYWQVQRGLKTEYRAGGESVGWMAGLDLRDNLYENKTTALACPGWGSCTVGDLTSDNVTDEKVMAAYGEIKFQATDSLIFTTNGRYDRVELDYTDHETTSRSGTKKFEVSSWRLGANYAARENLDIYGNISTGMRTPTYKQLFVGISSPSMQTDPNPNLTPEESINIELGIRTKTELFGTPLDIDMAIFQLDRKDFIQSSSGLYSTGTNNMWENIGDTRNRGLELAVQTDVQDIFSWELAYTYMDAKYTKYDNFDLRVCNSWAWGSCNGYATTSYDNAGNYVPRVPKHKVNLIGRYRPTSNWTITGEMTSSSSYYADEINQEEISGHTVFNLLVNYDREVGNSTWSFFARADNLFDKYYYNTARASGDDNEDGVYDQEDLSIVVNQGLTLTAGISVEF